MAKLIPITDLSAPELTIYTDLSEVQLLHCFEPDYGLFIAESPNVIERAIHAGYAVHSFLMEASAIDAQMQMLFDQCPTDVPVFTADSKILRQLTGFPMTRGALCALYRKELPSLETLCQNARRIAILENVMNPTNVGAIFRSAAALNIDAVILTGGCSDPLYRRAARVSMGTVFQIPWTMLDKKADLWPSDTFARLRQMGYETAAMALKEDSVSIADPKLKKIEKLAILLGTEGDGLSDATLALCDHTVLIPMTHGVDSLNVAAASAVAFWELTR